MAYVTIHTKDKGHLSFFVPDSGGYVRLTTDSKPGTLGRQICYGGGFHGSTVSATPETLRETAYKWIRQSRKFDF